MWTEQMCDNIKYEPNQNVNDEFNLFKKKKKSAQYM